MYIVFWLKQVPKPFKHKNSLAKQNCAHQNKVTSQTIMSYLQFGIGIQLISAKQNLVVISA